MKAAVFLVAHLPIVALVVALLLIIAGIALVYPPAAFIAAGIAVLAAVTFDPSKAGRLTWPR